MEGTETGREMNMCRIASLEIDFEHWNISYKFIEQVKLSEIDISSSHQNPARLGLRLNKEVVTAIFCQVVEQGNTNCINAIVVCRIRPGEPYTLLDGVHRCRGIDETDFDTVDVYEVDTRSEFELFWLAGSLNNTNGIAPLQTHRLLHAVELTEKFPGHTEDEIARRTKLKKEELIEYRKICRQMKRAIDKDVKAQFDTLRETVKAALEAISLDESFRLVVLALSHANTNIPTSKDLIRRIAKAKSQKDVDQILHEFVLNNPPPSNNRPRRGPQTSTQLLRDDHNRLWKHYPGSIEAYNLGSLDLKGLLHLRDIIKRNNSNIQLTLAYIKNLIDIIEGKEKEAAE